MAASASGSEIRTAGQQAFRYRQLAAEIERRIMDGTYAPGERLPSVRRLHRQTSLSISTVYQAYQELAATGFVEARPKSGYFVLPVSLRQFQPPVFRKWSSKPQRVDLAPVVNSVVAAISNPRFAPLGNTAADPALLPVKALTRILKGLSQEEMRALLAYSPSEGLPELRRQAAIDMLGMIEGVDPEDVVITNGCTEAVALSLLAVTRPGDTIAVETPTNFTFLQLLRELGLLVAEIATDPREGVDLDELERVLQGGRIRACLLMPNFQNPLGALMPEERKRALAEIVARYEVPVIEDDISSRLHFAEARPRPLKAYDRDDRVLTCSSFSKTLAPGLRLGWVIAGKRYRERVRSLKAGTTISTSTLDQHLVVRFFRKRGLRAPPQGAARCAQTPGLHGCARGPAVVSDRDAPGRAAGRLALMGATSGRRGRARCLPAGVRTQHRDHSRRGLLELQAVQAVYSNQLRSSLQAQDQGCPQNGGADRFGPDGATAFRPERFRERIGVRR